MMKKDNPTVNIINENPYNLIQKALDCMRSGDYTSAQQFLEQASLSEGKFFPADSCEDNDLKQAIILFRHILNNYPEEFRELLN